jgi:phosphate transport system substrate-binding protein
MTNSIHKLDNSLASPQRLWTRPQGKAMPLRTRARGTRLAKAFSSRRLAVIGVVIAALTFAPVASATTLFGSGSSAEQPYLLKLFKAYSKIHPKIHFRYNADGGNAGVQDVQAGRSEFSINTRAPLPSDAGTTYFKLYLDALCIAVNPSNSISNVSLPTLKNTFLGVDNNWGQVGGSNLTTTIDPIGRNSSAGLYTFFQQAVLGGKTQSSNVTQEASDGLVAVAVSKDPDAIGYVGLAHSTKSSGVKALTVDGVPCTAPYIRNESYPLFRYSWGVLPTADPKRQVEEFFDWVRTSKEAGNIINRAGAVAAFNK